MNENERRRPSLPAGAAQGEDRARALLESVFAANDNMAHFGLRDPRWLAAEFLADAWAPAMSSSYRMGYDAGHQAGWTAAERDMQRSWSRVVSHVQAVLHQPSHEELRMARGELE